MLLIIFFIFRKMAKRFWSVQGQNKYFFEYLKIDKLFSSSFFSSDFRVTVHIFWGPATKERGNIETWHFGIGDQQQFGTT